MNINKYTEPFTVWKLFKRGCSMIWDWKHVYIITLISSIPAWIVIAVNLNHHIVYGTPWLLICSVFYAELISGLSLGLFLTRNT